MDQELLAAIGDILDKKLDEKLDEKLAPINRQIDNISRTAVDVLTMSISSARARQSSAQVNFSCNQKSGNSIKARNALKPG